MGLKSRATAGLAALRRSGLPRRLVSGVVATLREAYKLGREMLVIPAQVWLLVAEIAGAVVLRAWLRVSVPLLRAAWMLLAALYALAARHVTPARAVAFVGLAAAVALVVSQWLDYRSVSVGTGAYAEGVQDVAPAPDVARDRAGEAHAWVMIPIAALGALGVVLAAAGRSRAAWLTIGAGLGAVAIAVGIDAPKGLDEGPAAIAYEGASAQLLEGFWAQIASGAALAGAGLLLLLHRRPESAPAAARSSRRRRERASRPRRLEGQAKLDARAEGTGA